MQNIVYLLIGLVVGGGAGALLTRLVTIKRISQSVNDQLDVERQQLNQQFERKLADNEELVKTTIAQKRETLEAGFRDNARTVRPPKRRHRQRTRKPGTP